MSSEEVIELSIAETNKLRAELGLKPLRVEGDSSQGDDEELLELSVDDTNKLREKLGLAPLRVTNNKNEEIHKPAENTGEQLEVSKRIERAKLQRQVEQGAAQVFGSSTLASDVNNENDNNNTEALSWAEMMRQKEKRPTTTSNSNSKRQKHQQQKSPKENDYNESDLEGMQVKNSMAGLEAGESTVLTLADAPILQTKTHSTKLGRFALCVCRGLVLSLFRYYFA